jgi:putative transposase
MKVVRIEPLKGLGEKPEAPLRDGQLEAAKCWNLCVDLHKTARNTKQPWPGLKELCLATKGKFQLAAQTVQQIVRAFLGSVTTMRKLKAQGYSKAKYPHKEKRFFPIMWPAQAVVVYEKKIVLPMGRGRKSIVLPRPPAMPDSGAAARIVWNGIGYELHWTLAAEEKPQVVSEVQATVDLGQIHQAAVSTNTGKALIVSGREIRSEKRGTNMMHGRMARKQDRCEKHSRCWWRLQRARNRHALRFDRRVRDLRHKGIRAVIDFCATHDVGRMFVGNPHGVRKASKGRKHRQRMSQWEYGKDIRYLEEQTTLAGIECFNGSERGTSSHCPRCGYQKKPSGRNWSCPRCGFKGHRDIVGSVNMHKLAFGQQIEFPVAITYLRPGQKSFWQAAGMKNPQLGSSSGLDTGRERRASGARVADGVCSAQPTHGCGAASAAGTTRRT